jgi:hypothetical protein
LEKKIAKLSKKITKQEKVIKIKEKNDEQITQLIKEIQVCWQTKNVTDSRSKTYLAIMRTEFVFSVTHVVVNTSGECRKLHDHVL